VAWSGFRQPHPGAEFYNQRGVKRRLGIKTRIAQEILPRTYGVLGYLGNCFPVIQVAHVFDDQRPDYDPPAYWWSPCGAYTHLFGINIADIIPRNLACQNNPPVRPAQLLGEWRPEPPPEPVATG